MCVSSTDVSPAHTVYFFFKTKQSACRKLNITKWPYRTVQSSVRTVAKGGRGGGGGYAKVMTVGSGLYLSGEETQAEREEREELVIFFLFF
jgi:hypothetical protein